MNLRERREAVDELDMLIRHSLRASVAHRQPAPDVRRQLLRRVSAQARRRLLWLPVAAPFWVSGPPQWPLGKGPGWNSLLYVSVLRTTRFIGFPSQIV